MKIKVISYAVAILFGILAAERTAFAEFMIDRTAMSNAYWNIWNDQVQAKIDADIEKYRKADATVEIPAPDGVEVSVEQKTHAFFFGAHIFNFDQLGKKEWNNRYKALYDQEKGLFNSATVAFYWRTLEQYPNSPRFAAGYEDSEEYWNREYATDPEGCKSKPHWRRPAVDPVISFLRTRRVRIHGHPLVWGNNEWHTPKWIWDEFCPESEKVALEKASGISIPVRDVKKPICTRDMSDPGEWRWCGTWRKIFKNLGEEKIAELVPTYLKNMESLYERRVREIAQRYGTRVDSWDVVNESATDFVRFNNKSIRKLPFDASHYGPMPSDYAYKAFAWAQKYLPQSAWLNLNDYNMDDGFFMQANDLSANGCRIDVVGSQMHLFNPKESAKIAAGKMPAHITPEGVAKRFERVSKAGKPIHLSEITITAPDNSEKGQMIQAIITRNCYRAWFAVEKMNGITWWNVVDNCGAPGEPSISGLFTRDMQPKAVYHAMNDLINREWKTKTVVAAKNGKIFFRGFRGRYHLSWKDASGKIQTKIVEVK